IVGENGRGKTTLLHVLTGRLEADTGTVTRQGTIGVAEQEMSTADDRTVGDAVAETIAPWLTPWLNLMRQDRQWPTIPKMPWSASPWHLSAPRHSRLGTLSAGSNSHSRRSMLRPTVKCYCPRYLLDNATASALHVCWVVHTISYCWMSPPTTWIEVA